MKEYYSLEIRDDDKLTKVFRVIFGVLCCAIAIFWAVYKLTSEKADETQWITVVFLTGFGAYQIYAGFGYAVKFIEFSGTGIRLKKNSFLPVINLNMDQLEKINFFPLKVVFNLRSGRNYLLRFGISDPERVSLIKEEILKFAENNRLPFEIMEESLE